MRTNNRSALLPKHVQVLLGCGMIALAAAASCRVCLAQEFNYRVGRAIRDVTGPPLGVQMWGFVRDGQTTQGIHLRLWSRAIVIADLADDGPRVAIVTVDLGSIPHPVKQSVVARLAEKFGDRYRHDNVVIAATHTHAGPGGYSPEGAASPLVGAFHREHFQKIVDGIYDSIVAADEDLQPGAIYLATGRLQNAGAQRSRTAYENNPAAERARYESDTDQQMTLLKLVDASGTIATINWFAVHPTSMTYNNRLISADHKGYAAAAWEMIGGTTYARPDDFVAAFAQSNCGDVTPNLNLDNTGPGADDFESTQIIGERQLAKARQLANDASTRLSGPIVTRHRYVDFSQLQVGDEFTHAGPQHTSPSAYGYAFAAGSTEDGGGHPLFHEGMTERDQRIDTLAAMVFKIPAPSDEIRAAHAPKAILFAPGATQPKPLQSQILPLGIVRIGQLTLIVGPAEFTTMAGRRIRDTVAAALQADGQHLVIAGYANSYAGYVTTKEEYDTQQYEGGHTLFGPWTLAGYQQEFARLASSTVSADSGDAKTEEPAPPDDWRNAKDQPLVTGLDATPQGGDLGAVVSPAHDAYHPGDTVRVAFWTGNPNRDFATTATYLTVERLDQDRWKPVATDRDWQTRCVWQRHSAAEDAQGQTKNDSGQAGGKKSAATDAPAPLQVTIDWTIPPDTPPGTYRIVHHGQTKTNATKSPRAIEAHTPPFRVE